MLITMLAIGSRGDIQPYIALGVALKNSGQRVRIATLENFKPFVTSFGLEYFSVQGDISSLMAGEMADNARQADNPLKLLRSFNQMKRYVFDLQIDLFEACQGADAVVYHPGATMGFFAARRLGIPSILATPFPMTPTGAYPALIFYDMPRLGKSFNRLTHKIFEQIMWMASSTPVREFWKRKFGRAPENFNCPYGKQTTRALPTVISNSEAVFARPADWPAHVHSTGYWFLDDEPNWKTPDALLAFLERGAPPVYVGFGSIADPKLAGQTTQMVTVALRRAGQRGVLARGWQGMADSADLSDDMFLLDSAPHAWLFPRMAAVVHHGGAGTTAAGLRAGVPAVIIPHGNDQFAWGRRVYELGVGSKPIPRKQLESGKLADAIVFALTDEVRQTARAVGASIQQENGAARAARIILESCS